MATMSAYLSDLRQRLLRGRRAIQLKLPARLSLRITRTGNFDKSDLGRALDEAFRLAESGRNELPAWIIGMSGMSGRRYRFLVNAVVGLISRPVYMEVGSWSGSTAASVLAGNSCELICIDNWSQFDGPREEFLANMSRANTSSNRVQILEKDFREVDFRSLEPKANIYLFDGPHSESDQFDGVVMAMPALQNQFLLVVDDYNWAQVRIGTERALAELGVEVEASIRIRTDGWGLGPAHLFQDSDWHNGYFLAVVTKTPGA